MPSGENGFPSMFCGRASDLAAKVCGRFLSVGSRPGYHRARSDQIGGKGFNELWQIALVFASAGFRVTCTPRVSNMAQSL